MTRKPRIKAKTSAVEKASTEKGSARSRAKTLMNEARKRNRTPINTQGEDVAKRMRSKMVNDAINSNASKKGTSSGNPPAKPSSGSKTNPAKARARELMKKARSTKATASNTQGQDVAKRMRSKMVSNATAKADAVNAAKESLKNARANISTASNVQGEEVAKKIASNAKKSSMVKGAGVATAGVTAFTLGTAHQGKALQTELDRDMKRKMDYRNEMAAKSKNMTDQVKAMNKSKPKVSSGGQMNRGSKPAKDKDLLTIEIKGKSASAPKGGKSMSQTMSSSKLGAPKGKMGSEMRKKEYDMRGWAYDETITGKAAPKPKASTAPKSNSNAAPIVSGKTLVQSGGGGAPVYETGKVTAPSVKTGTGGTTNMKTRTNYDDNIYGFANGGAVKGKYSRSVDNGGAVKGKYSRSVDKGVKCGSKAFMCGGKVKK